MLVVGIVAGTLRLANALRILIFMIGPVKRTVQKILCSLQIYALN